MKLRQQLIYFWVGYFILLIIDSIGIKVGLDIDKLLTLLIWSSVVAIVWDWRRTLISQFNDLSHRLGDNLMRMIQYSDRWVTKRIKFINNLPKQGRSKFLYYGIIILVGVIDFIWEWLLLIISSVYIIFGVTIYLVYLDLKHPITSTLNTLLLTGFIWLSQMSKRSIKGKAAILLGVCFLLTIPAFRSWDLEGITDGLAMWAYVLITTGIVLLGIEEFRHPESRYEKSNSL